MYTIQIVAVYNLMLIWESSIKITFIDGRIKSVNVMAKIDTIMSFSSLCWFIVKF